MQIINNIFHKQYKRSYHYKCYSILWKFSYLENCCQISFVTTLSLYTRPLGTVQYHVADVRILFYLHKFVLSKFLLFWAGSTNSILTFAEKAFRNIVCLLYYELWSFESCSVTGPNILRGLLLAWWSKINWHASIHFTIILTFLAFL